MWDDCGLWMAAIRACGRAGCARAGLGRARGTTGRTPGTWRSSGAQLPAHPCWRGHRAGPPQAPALRHRTPPRMLAAGQGRERVQRVTQGRRHRQSGRRGRPVRSAHSTSPHLLSPPLSLSLACPLHAPALMPARRCSGPMRMRRALLQLSAAHAPRPVRRGPCTCLILQPPSSSGRHGRGHERLHRVDDGGAVGVDPLDALGAGRSGGVCAVVGFSGLGEGTCSWWPRRCVLRRRRAAAPGGCTRAPAAPRTLA